MRRVSARALRLNEQTVDEVLRVSCDHHTRKPTFTQEGSGSAMRTVRTLNLAWKPCRQVYRGRDNLGEIEMTRLPLALASFAILVLSSSSAPAEMIHLMARKGDVGKVLAEIEKGVDVDLPSTSGARFAGSSPLVVAARFGRADVVKALLEAGADPNYRLPDFESSHTYATPLFTASGNGHTEVVLILLEAGADATVVDPWRGSALHIARLREHHEIEALLEEAGAPESQGAPSISHLL